MAKLQRKTKTARTTTTTQKATARKSTTKVVVDEIVDSSSLAGKRWILSIHGPRGVGKTLLGLSASSCAPKAWPPPKGKAQKYPDVLWLAFDFGATDTFADRNISVSVIDFHALIQGGMTVLQAMKKMVQLGANWARDNPEGIIVADTVTSLGHELEGYWEPRTADGFKKWAAVKESHAEFHRGLVFACKKVIYLFHTKAIVSTEENVKKVAKATRAPGGAELVPSLSGAGVDAYLNHSSIIIALQAKKKISSGKKTVLNRVCALSVTDGMEAKNRFSQHLNEEELPHLGAMLEKVRKGIGQ